MQLKRRAEQVYFVTDADMGRHVLELSCDEEDMTIAVTCEVTTMIDKLQHHSRDRYLCQITPQQYIDYGELLLYDDQDVEKMEAN